MSGPLVHDGLLPSPLGRGIPLNCDDVWGSRVDGNLDGNLGPAFATVGDLGSARNRFPETRMRLLWGDLCRLDVKIQIKEFNFGTYYICKATKNAFSHVS